MSHARLAALAVAASALIASGCGGSSKSSTHTESSALAGSTTQQASTSSPKQASTSSKPLTRTQLIAKADAICKRVNARLASSTAHNHQQIVRIAAQLAAFERTATGELMQLVPPAELATDWSQIVAGVRALADTTARYGEYAASNQLANAQKFIVAGRRRTRQAAAVAKRDGFTDCAHLS